MFPHGLGLEKLNWMRVVDGLKFFLCWPNDRSSWFQKLYMYISYAQTHTHIYTYIHTYTYYTHICMYIYMYMYICIYTLKQLHNIIWWWTCNICLTIWGAIHLCSRSTPVPTWSPTLSRPGITQFLQEEPQGFTAALKRSLFDFQVCTGHQLRQKCGREKQVPTILPHVT